MQLICTKVRMTIQLTNHGNLMVIAVINTPISSSSPASVLSIIENASSFSRCQPGPDQADTVGMAQLFCPASSLANVRFPWPG